ncbi:YbhB/YbcL family Raf kinase inhibitor-like protein [Intrasporangium calvum]|uniref:PEBP family protein n=1 Tax=Intrasporangium calvum (strain ATCC 23552 / DSM 43043 / JCM 3097 / NBRC 12989 / NCIMB 10167 / NRRL B-3866 / 7 KIP) TaxID=710696 RepID=E6S8S1_INTC7|nr:YbhB/YbcL family Raf kinase inhibitor-like protein [Intrasporangium calvum]ADU47040.1 PEBP family protein [Intrasporangium calvum DSM 43043]
MKLTSSTFAEGQEIPEKCGKRAQNVSPHLTWSDEPAGTRSFALTVVDWHPVARGYVHWMVCDIRPTTTTFMEGAAARGLPEGTRQVRAYAGPFPPSGTHDYVFTLHALDIAAPNIPPGATLDEFNAAVSSHTLATATLTGHFTRR